MRWTLHGAPGFRCSSWHRWLSAGGEHPGQAEDDLRVGRRAAGALAVQQAECVFEWFGSERGHGPVEGDPHAEEGRFELGTLDVEPAVHPWSARIAVALGGVAGPDAHGWSGLGRLGAETDVAVEHHHQDIVGAARPIDHARRHEFADPDPADARGRQFDRRRGIVRFDLGIRHVSRLRQ
jgi:hypothetical protein